MGRRARLRPIADARRVGSLLDAISFPSAPVRLLSAVIHAFQLQAILPRAVEISALMTSAAGAEHTASNSSPLNWTILLLGFAGRSEANAVQVRASPSGGRRRAKA